ncbi:MAG: transposase zinc-binding domain-containing protein [Acidobacteria bacterium]|nr:transposase zinc-binding domain-containing protein [Acidobacteriota bacterium]
MGCPAALPETYFPRRPEKSVLYETVAGHLETFLARQRERDRPIPRFVERELRKFLECGVAAGGFLRVHCDACGLDRVFPEEPVRQWVLSVPYPLRYRLANDASLVTAVARIFQRAVFASIRRRAGMRSLNRRARSGAVLFIQRFSDALNLDPHFHPR